MSSVSVDTGGAGAVQSGSPRQRLPWEYCECGCKGNAVVVGRMQLWFGAGVYGNRNLYTLRIGHGSTGVWRGDFRNIDDLDRAARGYAAPEYSRMKKQVETLAPCFA